jgi:hypothetical protein
MVVWIFFPRRLDPVLNGGVGDENAVVTPEVPGSRPVGQAVLDDQTDSPLLDTASVQTLGQGQVRQINGETAAAAGAAMAGEGNNHIDRLLGPRVTKIMQGPTGHGVTTCTTATARAGPRRVVSAAPLDPRFREIFNAGDPLRHFRNILPWPVHCLFS